MAEAILVLGLLLFIGGTALSVIEEWPKQGLTDTSFADLLLWLLGSVLIVVYGVLIVAFGVMIVGTMGFILSLYGFGLKAHDHRHFLKGLSLHALKSHRRL